MASTVPSFHRFMGQRCQDAALQIWNLFFLVPRKKKVKKITSSKLSMQTAKRIQDPGKVRKAEGCSSSWRTIFLD